MATFTKINDFVEALAEGAHDLDTHQLTVALSDTAPGSEGSNPTADGNGLLANVTQIAYTFLSSRDIILVSSSVASGIYKLVLTDLVLTSTGGTTGPLRYVYIYNLDTVVLADPLVCVYDYGSSISLLDGEQLTIDFDPTNGLFQLT